MSQIETLMVLALGSALTLVVVLLFGRFFWGMAVSAAAKRSARLVPIEVMDAQAERDKLRAEHALMARKLDLRLDDIKVRMAEQMAEVSRNRNRVQGLVEEIERKDELLHRAEQDNANLAAQIEVHSAELAAAHKTIEGLNADAGRGETEKAKLQLAFRKLSVSAHAKQQAFHSLSDDLRAASAPELTDPHTRTEQILRRRVAEITAISEDMKRQPTTDENSGAPLPLQLNSPLHTDALSAKLDEAHRMSDNMERELKSLDDMLALSGDHTPKLPRHNKQRRLGGNVISLAQRIRALQKGMGD